ncbi:MAG: DNA topoisomerase I, partial [Candidatus Diapherotrites archaeon]|nr:DNA topoisomerase I [Candidatus Diapherotrites archaeon]
MILILAEKTKAGRRLAEILSGGRYKTLKSGKLTYFLFSKDGKDYMVVPLRGHVIDVDFPKEYSRWSLKGLKELTEAPVVQRVTFWDVIKFLKSIRDRVEGVIVATDADREGEAIGLEVVDYLFRDKPVARAWFSSLTPSEVRRAFSNLLKPRRSLAEAAFARRDVDLLWGAVLTRALSLTSGRRGKNFLSVGRVQTPTLALIVEREREIRNFVPEPYWILKVRFPSFWAEHPKKIKEERLAKEMAEKVKGKKGVVKSFKKGEKKVPRPVPFDTTTFLSEASKLLGIPPKEALDIAEDLYMSGLISYPRTDNQTYPPDLPFSSILQKLS